MSQQSGLSNNKGGLLAFNSISGVESSERRQDLASAINHFVSDRCSSTSSSMFQDAVEFQLGRWSHHGLNAYTDQVFRVAVQQGSDVGGNEQEHAGCRQFRPELVLTNATT
jgi:hypothetical protein